jgi:plasmid maintenance system killer protein
MNKIKENNDGKFKTREKLLKFKQVSIDKPTKNSQMAQKGILATKNANETLSKKGNSNEKSSIEKTVSIDKLSNELSGNYTIRMNFKYILIFNELKIF